MDAPTRARHRALMRELRRGLTTWVDAIFVWARDEPDADAATLAREIAKALARITKAMAAWSRDGVVVPGDSRTLPRSGNVPPHDFTT